MLRAYIADKSVATNANMLGADIVAPPGSGLSLRVFSFVKDGATNSALLVRMTAPDTGATPMDATLRNGETNEVQDEGQVYTYDVDVPPGFSLNFRPGANTTWGILAVSDRL
jgi:hypothetical protein